jgi:hypothetical protein
MRMAVFCVMTAVCLVFSGCAKSKPPGKAQISMQAETLVNFSLVKSGNVKSIVDNSDDGGKVLEAILKYNETNDPAILDMVLVQLGKDSPYWKRLTVLKDMLDTAQ